MLWTIFLILLILWLTGLMTGYTMGGFIHILLGCYCRGTDSSHSGEKTKIVGIKNIIHQGRSLRPGR